MITCYDYLHLKMVYTSYDAEENHFYGLSEETISMDSHFYGLSLCFVCILVLYDNIYILLLF